MKLDSHSSWHRVSPLTRSSRLTLRAESREEQDQLARMARLALRSGDWWSEIAPELERLEALQPGTMRSNGAAQ